MPNLDKKSGGSFWKIWCTKCLKKRSQGRGKGFGKVFNRKRKNFRGERRRQGQFHKVALSLSLHIFSNCLWLTYTFKWYLNSLRNVHFYNTCTWKFKHHCCFQVIDIITFSWIQCPFILSQRINVVFIKSLKKEMNFFSVPMVLAHGAFTGVQFGFMELKWMNISAKSVSHLPLLAVVSVQGKPLNSWPIHFRKRFIK